MAETENKSNVTETGRGTVFMLVARMVFLVTGFIVSIILARGLGPAEFGIYGVIMSLLLWIEMVLAAGIQNATTKVLHDHPDESRSIEASAHILLLGWALFLFAVCWFAAETLAQWLNIPDGTRLFRLAILDLPLMAIYLAYQGILNGRRMFGVLSAGLIIHTSTKLLGVLILLALGLSVSGALIAHVVATFVVLLVLVTRYPVSIVTPSPKIVRTMLGLALPMGSYLIVSQVLLGVGLWMLKALQADTVEAAGYYVASLNLTRIFMVIPSVVSVVLFTSLAWALSRSDERKVRDFLQGATRFGLILLVPGCTLVVIDAEGIMVLLFSELYRAGENILRYQSIAFSATAFFDILVHALMAAGALWKSVMTVLVLLPVLVTLSWYLIGSMGADGAALALAISMSVAALVASVLTYRQFGYLVRLSTVTRVIVATGVVGLASTYIPADGIALVVKLTVLLGLYLVILALLREIGRDDLRPFAVWAK